MLIASIARWVRPLIEEILTPVMLTEIKIVDEKPKS